LDAENALKTMPLPNDVEIKQLYTRRFLVDATIRTIAKNLAEGAALVIVVLLVILGNIRAALLVSLAIPISMLFAAAGMKYFGISANLMSLGAIDFGLLVDASVVIIENVLRRLAIEKNAKAQRAKIILAAVKEVLAPVTVGILLIMAVYVPILALEGVEGKLFKPMAYTVLMALGASLIVAIVLMPVLAYLLLYPSKKKESETKVFKAIKRTYEPMLRFSLANRAAILIPFIVLAIWAGYLFTNAGSDFMPALNEGDMVVNLTRDNSISLSSSIELQKKSDIVIASFPEVKTVFSRIGTPESATDPMGVHLSDTFVILDHASGLVNKPSLFASIRKAIEKEVPGQEISENQPIEMRFNEILEGSRADVTLRIFGSDLDTLLALTKQATLALSTVPGASDVELDGLTALRKSPVLNIRLDYDQIARYGVDIEQVNHLLEMGMGGIKVGSFYDNQWRFPIVVRVAERLRDQQGQIAKLPVGLSSGGSVALGKLASISQKKQVTTIAHQAGQRYAGVSINLAGRDTEGFVKQAKEVMAQKVLLPEGYSLSWGGQFKNLEKARAKLRLIVPLVLLVIFLALLQNFRSLRQTLLVYLSIPFAMVGGVLLLSLREIPFSISAAIGFIALTGIAILNAMVLVTFFNQLREAGTPLKDAVLQGAAIRLRPVLMTALVASFGFVPMALNTGLGAEVQRPLATVVIGGLISSTILTLLLIPSLYFWVEKRGKEKSL
jgi:cobalt-zinc-cadmium resistance protein CzcA